MNKPNYNCKNYNWQDVPYDWQERRCPDSTISGSSLIEVEFRDGFKQVDFSLHWKLSWIQRMNSNDIIRFRLFN